MLTLIENPGAIRPSSRRTFAAAVAPAEPARLFGDPELAALLDAVRLLLGLSCVATHLIDEHGTVGPLIAAAGTRAIIDEGDPPRQIDLDDVDPWSGRGSWLRGPNNDPDTHVLILSPRVRDRVALLCQPQRQGTAGRAYLEERIIASRSLIERTIGQWAKSHVQALRLREQKAIFDTLGSGLLVVDADCHIHMSNAAARAAAIPGILSLANDRLVIEHVDDALRFHVLLQRSLTLDGSASDTVMTALRRSGAPPLMLGITGLTTKGMGPPLATVQIIDPQAELALPMDTLSRHYDLTQAEARLIEQLVRGKTLAEAAIALRLKEQTARTYLKHIFQKTGLRRQVELIRVVLAGSVPSLVTVSA